MDAVSEPRWPIGKQFRTSGRHPKLCTVTDILKTYDTAGRLVRVRYVATHEGPFGQIITDQDVCDATIARNAA